MTKEMFTIFLSELNTGIPNTLQDLFNDTYFTDVTLATADDQQIKAHKVILSSFSPLFKSILLKNNHPTPVIYLKDIQHSELLLIMELIYLGQCRLVSEHLEKFLACAKDLQILGLEDGNFETHVSGPSSEVEMLKNVEEGEGLENCGGKYVCEEDVEESDFEELECKEKYEKQNLMNVEHVERSHQIGGQKGKSGDAPQLKCPICNKNFKNIGNLIKHRNSCQIINKTVQENIDLICNICATLFENHTSLNNHIVTVHKKQLFFCSLCQMQKQSVKGMAKHMKFAHEDRVCDVCKVVLKSTKELKQHKHNKHYTRKQRGKSSPYIGGNCSLCQKQFKSKFGMSRHTKLCKDYSDMILKKESDLVEL